MIAYWYIPSNTICHVYSHLRYDTKLLPINIAVYRMKLTHPMNDYLVLIIMTTCFVHTFPSEFLQTTKSSSPICRITFAPSLVYRYYNWTVQIITAIIYKIVFDAFRFRSCICLQCAASDKCMYIVLFSVHYFKTIFKIIQARVRITNRQRLLSFYCL